MDEKNIQTLLEELHKIADSDPNAVFNLVIATSDVVELTKRKLTSTEIEIARNFAYAGFFTGAEWVLRNIEEHKDEKAEQTE